MKYFLMLALLLIPLKGYTFEPMEYVTYFGTTDERVTMGWDAVLTATSYEVRGKHVERNVYVDFGKTVGLNMEIQLPQTGHYIMEVRAVNDNATNEECMYSEWSTSISPQAKVGEDPSRTWWLYGHVAPPGELIIK